MCISFRPKQAILAASISLIFLMTLSARAQQGGAAETVLDAVVVTATRTPTRVNELTTDVTIIDREQIEGSGPTLREVLRQVPGIEVTQNGGPGTAMSVFMRGANSDHTLVIVDGLRLGSATLGTTAFENIPLDTIERIEVLRGPASSLYGSSAIGGVIQIFTRSGAGNPGWNLNAGAGSYGTKKFSIGKGYEKDGWRYSFQLGGSESDGITAIRDSRSRSFNPDADGYRNSNFVGNVAKTFGRGREVGLRTIYSDGRNQFDSVPAVNDFRTYSTLNGTSLYGRSPIGARWSTQLTLGKSTDDSTSYTSANNQSVIRTVQDQAIWQNDVKLPVGSLMLSLESLKQRINGTTAFPVTTRDIRTYAAAYQGSVGPHSFQVSGRQDRYDQYGTKNTGYAGYGFNFNREFRATIGTGSAFKAPTFNQLYFPAFGNPTLLPESARNDEVGLQYNGNAVQVGVVHFRNRVTNLIINAGTPLRPRNVGEAKLSGTTVTASTRIYDTELSGNVNFQDPRDATNGLLLPRRAKRFATLTASRSAFGGKAGMEVFTSGPRFNDAANLVNMGGYTLLNAYYDRPIDKQWTMFARLDNLGNRLYETVQFFNVPGRSLFLGVRYQEN